MNQINHTTLVSAILTQLKTVADTAFQVVGPGEQDPDMGETAAADAVQCFARLDSVRVVFDKRRTNGDVHSGMLEVGVMVIGTAANSNPLTDISSQLQSIINVLELAILRPSSGNGQLNINLQCGEISEQTPSPEMRAARIVSMKFVGSAKAE